MTSTRGYAGVRWRWVGLVVALLAVFALVFAASAGAKPSSPATDGAPAGATLAVAPATLAAATPA
ncbi:MAG: hypothetical protein JNL97_04995, partial [Verrucomicrobiales bacterium]|nr:hypothetical protein [Verrucomicrobiales bacterium]